MAQKRKAPSRKRRTHRSRMHDHTFFAGLNCPNPVTWSNDIRQMFTPTDILHMKTKGIDLGDYHSVKINAVPIYNQVSSHRMPPPGSGEQPWPQSWIDTFGCWIQQGCPQ
jgi:hypothetical protein